MAGKRSKTRNMKPKAWRKLTDRARKEVSKYAQQHGMRATCEEFNVSESAVRHACAVNAVAPKPMYSVASKEARVKQAIALLRTMRLTPEDLIA